MSTSYLFEFLSSWGLTILIESSVLLLLTSTKTLSRRIFAGVFASTATLPYLWFVLPHFIHNYPLFLTVGELCVAVVEAVIYFFVLEVSPKKALFLSFICNLISFSFGLLMQNLLH